MFCVNKINFLKIQSEVNNFLHLNQYYFTEWTTTLIKFLKDQIPKLTEYYQSPTTSLLSDKTPPSQSGELFFSLRKKDLNYRFVKKHSIYIFFKY